MLRFLSPLLGACILLVVASALPAAVLPAGFQETNVLTTGGLADPRAIAWSPDGALWILLGDGSVHIHRGGTPIKAADLAVDKQGEHGANGIEIDPDYATNHHVWIYYTAESPIRNRVSRFTNVGDVLTDETVVVDGPILQSNYHTGGCLRFGTDKTLYVSTGDDSQGSATAQNPHDLRGKILRVDRTGAGVPGNPYFDGIGGDPRVWALGLRNPYRCNLQPDTDNLFVGDVGGGSYEEIDIVPAGANLGWAAVEGPSPPGLAGFVYPIYWYDHSETGNASVIGGDHARPGDFAPEYEGDYFFGDWSLDRLYRMKLDDSNNPTSTEIWATGIRGPSDIRFGPDSALYYTSENSANIRKISYVGGTNRQPVALATATPDAGAAPLAVHLDGTASYDPDQDPLTYWWDLGDGASSTSPFLTHGYAQGVHHATLTVEDGNGGSSTAPQIRIVSGNHRPTAATAAPADESRYDAGRTIFYSGTGTDPEDGALTCSRFRWKVNLHHAEHAHPFLGPLEGACSGSFTTAERGETSADVFYEIALTVEDSGAPLASQATLTGASSVEIRPNTATMTFRSAPLPDLQLTLDTQPFGPPRSELGVVNFIRLIGAVEPQLRPDGHSYRWVSWSDGGARDHEIRTPATGSTYTATFGCDVLREVRNLRLAKAAGNGLTLSWSPVADSCLAGEERYRIYSAAAPVPATPPGTFPTDPEFTLVGTSPNTVFTYVPAQGHSFFLVVAVGTDHRDGPVGHYGR